MTPHERYARALRNAADAARDVANLSLTGGKPIVPPSAPGVYFAMANDRIKIGCAKNVASRLRDLQTSAPYPLRLLAVAPGGRKEESAFHERFKRLRVQGEWFSVSRGLLSFIATLQEV